MPTPAGGLEVAFDLCAHRLRLPTTDGQQRELALEPRTVADFYAEYRAHLSDLGVDVAIDPMPVELPEVIAFDSDTVHASYDPQAVNAFWRSTVSAASVMARFRGEFRGKASNVHFFWGAFDLAVTRFSGRGAPEHPGGIPNCPDWVMRDAYDAELSSCGYWPGGREEGLFYAYAYPEPAGFRERALTDAGRGLRRRPRRVRPPVPHRARGGRPGGDAARLPPRDRRRGRRARRLAADRLILRDPPRPLRPGSPEGRGTSSAEGLPSCGVPSAAKVIGCA